MKTKHEIQIFVDEVRALCNKHNVVMMAEGEGIAGILLVAEADSKILDEHLGTAVGGIIERGDISNVVGEQVNDYIFEVYSGIGDFK